MNFVFLAALGIGGSTLIGTGCGFLIDRIGEKSNRRVTAFAAGVMLAAAVFGLFAPAMDMARGWGILLLATGAVCGALFLRATALLFGRLRGEGALRRHPDLMFVLAIAVHKFPEGMAGGVGLNSMDRAAAMTVIIGIALQNLPEGAVMIPPLLHAGVGRWKAAGIALATGLLNALGVLAGALWGYLPGGVMPFALCFAGGAMLDVIVSQMIPRNHSVWVTLAGFLIMVSINALF